MGPNVRPARLVAATAMLVLTSGLPVVAQGSPLPVQSASLVPAETIHDAGATRLTIRPYADWVITAEGSAWVAVGSAVTRLDGADGIELASIPVPGEPCLAMDVGFESLWVGACRDGSPSVVRSDPRTADIIATIALPVGDLQFESSVAAGEEAVVSTQPVQGGDIAVGGGSVWARISDQLVARIDPAVNEIVARYGPPAGSGSVAADEAAAWISAHDVNAVWRLPLDKTGWRTSEAFKPELVPLEARINGMTRPAGLLPWWARCLPGLGGSRGVSGCSGKARARRSPLARWIG